MQLGNDGFSEKNKVYQASNGAVYGLIKKIQYPTGRCEKYSYSENRMSSVPLDLEENIYNLKKQKQVISPYGTHVILRLFNDNRYTINVYKYSVQGWFANELFSGETTEAMFDAYDTDIYVDFTDNDLVITSLDYLTVKVYRLSNSVINKWKEINYTTLYEGTVTDVNIGNNKLLISTVINGDFYLYPYIFDGAQYHLVGNAINVKEKCGITAMVAATCMQDKLGEFFTLYKDSYSIAPVGFAGRALTYYKNILRCFFIRNDGTTSQVQDIGYVPNVVVMTNFTSSVPPIVASPIELSAHITIGGNISKIGKVEKIG